jgi:CHAT domain-containing protein
MSKKGQVSYYTGSEATEEIFKNEAPKSRIVHVATHGFFYPDPKEIDAGLESENESGPLIFRGGKAGFGVRNFVHNKNPLMRSGIVLAGANDVWFRTQTTNENSLYKEDGVLTAQEVATIDMRSTDLVVLSACETGLGDIKGSEGVYGLLRSFKMAGVKTLIISLWQVPDKETAEFMTLFYKNLIKSNDIELSFYKAQEAMRKKYDPYYWAAFVLIF